MKIKCTITVELPDDMYSVDDSGKLTEDEKLWLENEILIGNGSLILHSNEIGDEVGIIKSVKNIQWL